MSFFKTKYCVRADNYLGWEVLYKKWYYISWHQVGYSNTFSTKEEAIKFAENHKIKIYI